MWDFCYWAKSSVCQDVLLNRSEIVHTRFSRWVHNVQILNKSCSKSIPGSTFLGFWPFQKAHSTFCQRTIVHTKLPSPDFIINFLLQQRQTLMPMAKTCNWEVVPIDMLLLLHFIAFKNPYGHWSSYRDPPQKKSMADQPCYERSLTIQLHDEQFYYTCTCMQCSYYHT
jgi:hypothetical protein